MPTNNQQSLDVYLRFQACFLVVLQLNQLNQHQTNMSKEQLPKCPHAENSQSNQSWMTQLTTHLFSFTTRVFF
jgi:hypothetical protein